MTIARSPARRSLASLATIALLCGAVALLCVARPSHAGNGGEARSITRDGDRPYGVVAGEADASATVQNPANLAYLSGFDAIIDMSINQPRSGRRGHGVGVFAAVPLPWQILAFGVGIQALWRTQADTNFGTFANVDEPFGKFTIAAALPLMRWAPGLALGVQYSRMFSANNDIAAGVNQFDLALSWRANRYLSLALVARNLNVPRIGDAGRQVPVLDPELALRPLGDARLEFAFGGRIRPVAPSSLEGDACQFVPQVTGCVFQPRGRVLLGLRGVRVYAEAEAYAHVIDVVNSTQEMYNPAVRISAGVQFDTPHFGIAAGPNMGLGMRDGTPGLHGVNARVRLSYARETEVLPSGPRRVTRIALAGKDDDRELAEVVWTIDELTRRASAVVLVELRGNGFSTAQLEELREALLRLRDRGGKVVAYLEGGDLSQYFLASAADRIIAHPHAALSIVGLSSRTFYWGELLGRLGIRAEFVRMAEYKGTPERFESSGPSAPVDAANRALLTDVWNHLVREIGQARARDPAVVSDWVDAAPWQPEDARRRGIIDDLAWPDELDAELEAWLGRKVRIEPPPKSPVRESGWGDPAHVAILHVHGDLVSGESFKLPLLGYDVAGSDTLTKQIAKLRDDPDVKAVVVRIDSRGGSVRAAEAIAHELDLTAAHKPVVISMGTAAASGGYYIATGGQYIFADATTLTGSIGVYYPKLDLSGLLDKIGVHADMLAIGERATMRSHFKPYSDDERDAAQAGVAALYDTFIERVARARAMTPEAADAVARGRVWSGVRAIEVGLVDRYGGLVDAVQRAAAMAELPVPIGAAPPVRHYPPRPTILQQIRTLFGLQLSLPLGSTSTDRLTGTALGFADPILRTLRLLPAAFWYAGEPEALAIMDSHVEIEG